jgi:thiol:disulfide interchange protein
MVKTMHDLSALRAGSEPVEEYIAAPSDATEAFNQRLQEYELDPSVIEKLKAYAGKSYIFAFSAEWCKDCKNNIPVLKLIQDVADIKVRILSHIIRDAKNPNERWKIPPSPPEVKEFNVLKIPHIAVLNPQGEELGAVIENPPEDKTLEEALLEILEST